MRIPGFTVATGGLMRCSDAAIPLAELGVVAVSPVSGTEVVVASSCLIVDVEVDLLLKPLVKGAR